MAIESVPADAASRHTAEVVDEHSSLSIWDITHTLWMTQKPLVKIQT